MKTKKIRISTDKIDAINKAIDQVEKYARARLLSVESLFHDVEEAEERLDKMGVPKALRRGATIEHLPPRVPNSYNGRAEGTAAIMERGSKSWYLREVWRADCGHESYGGYPRIHITLPYHAALLDSIARANGIKIQRESTL